jgi:hypothetical protein
MRFSSELLRGWKRQAEEKARVRIGKTNRTPKQASAEHQIRRDIKIRSQLEEVLLRPAEDFRQKRIAHCSEKFRYGKLVIHSVDDTTYPNVDEAQQRRISGWLVVEPYDFYHGGLAVILTIRLVLVDADGHWAYVDERASSSDAPDAVKAWVLGRIPWRNIRVVQPDGDRHYNVPHLYCSFADDGMPYEAIVAAVMDEESKYPIDWPLDPTKQHPDVGLDDLKGGVATIESNLSSDPKNQN